MKFFRKSFSGLISVIFASAIAVFLYLRFRSSNAELPIINPADLNPELVDLDLRDVYTDHTIGSFKLINQYGDSITLDTYSDKVFVTDFFFTRCPSICPIMTNNMEKIQEHFKADAQLGLLSISVTPEYDSVPVLEAYATKNSAIPDKWNICTGDKDHIYELARKHFFAVTEEGDGALQDFIHTPNFILVDTQKRIRGIYDGTKDDEIERVIKDIESLLD